MARGKKEGQQKVTKMFTRRMKINPRNAQVIKTKKKNKSKSTKTRSHPGDIVKRKEDKGK